jgi:hypothetical protein
MSSPLYTPRRLKHINPVDQAYANGLRNGTGNGYGIGFQDCKKKALDIILKNTKYNFTLADILKMTEEINKL